MKDPIFIISYVIRRCPFSKNIIKPKTMLCVFNKYQYSYFVIQIKEILSLRLPEDIINLIIDFTNYKKLLNRAGLEKYVNWQDKDYISSLSMIRLKNRKKLLLLDTSDDSNSDLSDND
jgi:hypothetical protein|tara:strand:- start:10083 stop:10436 length:354 start_codon:yes stop_codon:yes gene_type:complete